MDREGRLKGADFMRALACLMVLAHHLVLRLDWSRVATGLRPGLELARFGSYGVAIFFVLSGFLLARPFWIALDGGLSMPPLKIYALRRAARVLPGFWTTLTVGFLLSFTVYGASLNGELVWRYLAGFFLMSQWHWRTFFPVDADGPLWSIPFEATCYVLLPFGFALLFTLPARLAGQSATRLVWLAVIAMALLGHWLVVQHIPMDDIGRSWDFGLQGGAKEWMPRFNPVGFFVIFAIGALAAGAQTRLSGSRSFIFDIVALLALAAGARELLASVAGEWEGYGWLGVPYRFPLLPLAAAAALCALPQSMLVGPLLDNRIIRFIATVSFGIYIWQDIVISLMKRLFPGSFGAGADDALVGWAISCAVATILILTIATASYVFLERPVMRWARGLEGGGSSPRAR